MEQEIWKDIEGFEGKYMISNQGRVKCLKPRGGTHAIILKERYDGHGYPQACLWLRGKPKYISVHRLVALTFIPNPHSYPEINHKDENPKNNRAENLEWCTRRYNLNYGGHNRRMVQSKTGKTWDIKTKAKRLARLRRGASHPLSKPVEQYTLDGIYVATFANRRLAAQATGANHSQIGDCCNGKCKSAGGFLWRDYLEERI